MTISPRASPAGRWDSTRTWTPGSVGTRRRSMGNCAPASGRLQKFPARVWRCGLWSSGSKLGMRQPVVLVVYDYAHTDERFVWRGDWLGPDAPGYGKASSGKTGRGEAGAAEAAAVFAAASGWGAVAVEPLSRQG